MSLKQAVRSCAQAVGRLPGINNVLYNRSVRGAIQTLPGIRAIYGGGWNLLHPFDRALGTDTSGFVASSDLPSSPFDATRKHVYAGSQPSIIRTALAALPPLNSFAFVDLGCGKGRPLLVATEFPFREIIGVELSPTLATEARKNAAILQARFPDRLPIRIETGDASTFTYPAGNLVVFLYNPFGEEIIAKVVAGIEAALAAEKTDSFHRLLQSRLRLLFRCLQCPQPLLRRHDSLRTKRDHLRPRQQRHSSSSGRPAMPPTPHRGADNPIKITNPASRAELLPLGVRAPGGS